MGEEDMIDKLLKAISLKDEDCTEELDNASQKTSFIITMIIFALIGAAAVGYLFYMRNSTKYKYDDSLTVSKNGTHIVYDESGAYLMHQEKVLSDIYMAIEKDPYFHNIPRLLRWNTVRHVSTLEKATITFLKMENI